MCVFSAGVSLEWEKSALPKYQLFLCQRLILYDDQGTKKINKSSNFDLNLDRNCPISHSSKQKNSHYPFGINQTITIYYWRSRGLDGVLQKFRLKEKGKEKGGKHICYTRMSISALKELSISFNIQINDKQKNKLTMCMHIISLFTYQTAWTCRNT